jgi:hypothetical protein
MKRFLFISIVLLVAVVTSCKKSSDSSYNSLEITGGDFAGFTYTFSPNRGFWSPVDQTTRYMHLVLGADDNQAGAAENVMSIVFYYNGTSLVQFPSPEGQWARFGINIEGTVYYFEQESLSLTIIRFDDLTFDGVLTGQCREIGNNTRKISISLSINIPMQQI